MRTIVILVQARDGDLPLGRPLIIITDGSVQDVALAVAEKKKHVDESTIHHESPPFWTWFVENPRPSRRVSS